MAETAVYRGTAIGWEPVSVQVSNEYGTAWIELGAELTDFYTDTYTDTEG